MPMLAHRYRDEPSKECPVLGDKPDMTPTLPKATRLTGADNHVERPRPLLRAL